MHSSSPPSGGGPADQGPPTGTRGADTPGEALSTLAILLDVASRLASDAAGDELLQRLRRVFELMPVDDRPTILQVLEREVELRRFAEGIAEAATGYETRPNPNARLYVRVVTTPEPPPAMTHDELVVVNHRGLRVLRYVLGSSYAVWRQAMADAVALLDPEERAAARRVLAEALGFLEAADAPPPDRPPRA
jgi:hypothetical protein